MISRHQHYSFCQPFEVKLCVSMQVKQREQSRQRMQAYRARKKANEPAKLRKTRAAKEEQREKWREAKAKWWANLNPQKKRRVKERRAQRERENRASKNGRFYVIVIVYKFNYC